MNGCNVATALFLILCCQLLLNDDTTVVVAAFRATHSIRRSSSFLSSSSSSSSSSLSPHHHRRRILHQLDLSSTATAATATPNGSSMNEKAAAAPKNGTQQPATSSSTTSPINSSMRLSVSEKARTVTAVSTSGTLCTVSAHDGIQGAPFGSFVDYVLDDQGSPILLMNDMSMHTINIRKQQEQEQEQTSSSSSPLVTLFTQLASNSGSMEEGGDLQDVSRCSLTGTLQKINADDPQMDAIRMRYSLTHAYADQVMDSPKFAFYRLTPKAIYFVGGFGVLAKWIEPADYATAAPDILAKEAPDIVQKINRQHVEDMRFTAQHLLHVDTAIEKIRLTNVDRLGMDLRVTSQMKTRRNKLQTDEFRIGFRIPVQSVEDAKSEILKVFQEAWEKGNGYSWGGAGDEDDQEPGADVPILKIAADSLE